MSDIQKASSKELREAIHILASNVGIREDKYYKLHTKDGEGYWDAIQRTRSCIFNNPITKEAVSNPPGFVSKPKIPRLWLGLFLILFSVWMNGYLGSLLVDTWASNPIQITFLFVILVGVYVAIKD